MNLDENIINNTYKFPFYDIKQNDLTAAESVVTGKVLRLRKNIDKKKLDNFIKSEIATYCVMRYLEWNKGNVTSFLEYEKSDWSGKDLQHVLFIDNKKSVISSDVKTAVLENDWEFRVNLGSSIEDIKCKDNDIFIITAQIGKSLIKELDDGVLRRIFLIGILEKNNIDEYALLDDNKYFKVCISLDNVRFPNLYKIMKPLSTLWQK